MRKIALLLFALACTVFVKAQLAVDVTFTLSPGGTCTQVGDLTAHATGGVANASGLPYDYTWYELVNNTSGAFDTISLNLPVDSIARNLSPGRYLVKVRDLVPDSVYGEFIIMPAIDFAGFPVNPGCFNGSNGSISTEVTSVYGVASYLWSNGGVTDTLQNLVAGTYSVLITDALGCQASFSVDLFDPPRLEIDSAVTFGCVYDLAVFEHRRIINIDITTSNGQPNSYLWTGPGGFTSNSQNISPQNNLAGTYKVVIGYNTGCVDSMSVDFGSYTPISASYTIVNPTCYGSSNGSFQLNISNGIPPFQYLWNGVPTTNLFIGNLAESSNLLENIGDSIGCFANFGGIQYFPFDYVSIVSPALLTANASTFDVQCFDSSTGFIDVMLDGGTPFLASGSPTYIYNWNNGQFNTEDLANLHAGSYQLLVTDSLGCTVTLDTSIINQRPAITNTETHTDLVCNAANIGWIKLSITGGEPPYQCNWTGPLATIPGQGTDSVYNLAAGTYYVTITDEFLCQKLDTIVILQPDLIVGSVTTTLVTCPGGNDGTASVVTSGGVPPYTYRWAGPGGFTANTTSVNNMITGNYFVYITDANDCEVQTPVTITSNTSISIGGVAVDPNCSGTCDGKVILSIGGGVSGGVPGLPPNEYNYLWSNGAVTQDIIDLCPGSYSVTVTDSKNCTKTKNFTLAQPPPFSIELGPDRTLCDTQQLRLNIGLPDPANYTWTGPNNFTASTESVTINDAGKYYVLVSSDPGRCIAEDSIVVSRITDRISSVFLVSTQAFKGKTVTIVNISDPLPQTVQWIVPTSPNISVLSSTDRILELVFSDTGKYVIGMKAIVGPCEETSAQDVIVVKPEPGDSIVAEAPLIREFTVYPNPVSTPFNVRIRLKEKSRIRLRMYNVNTSALIDDRRYGYSNDAYDRYDLSYNISPAPGIYVLLLETPNGSMVYKIVKN